MRIALIISAGLHVALLLVLLIGLPRWMPKEEEPPETTVAMVCCTSRALSRICMG